MTTTTTTARDHGHSKYKHDNDKDRRDRRCKGRSTDLGLINGRFLDPASGKTYRDLAIKDGRISSLSSVKGLEDGARIIDLKGRTAIPGLINMHVHHSRTGTTPDYEVRDIETAFSIREIQELIARRARSVPAGRFVGCHLGWHYVQLDEGPPADESGAQRCNVPACRLCVGPRRLRRRVLLRRQQPRRGDPHCGRHRRRLRLRARSSARRPSSA